jgi:uncharacterized protein DUF4384
MGNPRLLAMRTAAVLPFLAVLSACATVGGVRPARIGGEAETVVERGPRAQIWTTDEFGTGDRIRASFRLDDDAYVVVVNVGRDGYANVVFPESSDDDGFMRGGRTYRLPPFFPGFANNFGASRYGRLYNATSAHDDVYDRYAGYVFIIASWRPMHFRVAEGLGLWDGYRLAAREEQLEPYVVMHRFADRLVQGLTRDYTARFARYAAFDGGVGRAGSFASCSAYGSFLGDFPPWAFSMLSRSWIPVYGLGYYGLGAMQCGYGFGITLVGFRPRVRPIVSSPVKPAPGPVSGDTAAKPRHPRQPRPPRVASDSGERKQPPRGRRVEIAVEEEPIIDVTNETRELSRRRDRDADRMRRAVRSERGYQPTDGSPGATGEWRRTDSDRATGRTETPRDVDRNEGARARTSEPRPGSPPRAEPRAEPRQEARPQPPPRNDPPPRTEPAARAEPRSDRPVKPDRQ